MQVSNIGILGPLAKNSFLWRYESNAEYKIFYLHLSFKNFIESSTCRILYLLELSPSF